VPLACDRTRRCTLGRSASGPTTRWLSANAAASCVLPFLRGIVRSTWRLIRRRFHHRIVSTISIFPGHNLKGWLAKMPDVMGQTFNERYSMNRRRPWERMKFR
jgi:hypothetical protein